MTEEIHTFRPKYDFLKKILQEKWKVNIQSTLVPQPEFLAAWDACL